MTAPTTSILLFDKYPHKTRRNIVTIKEKINFNTKPYKRKKRKVGKRKERRRFSFKIRNPRGVGVKQKSMS